MFELGAGFAGVAGIAGFTLEVAAGAFGVAGVDATPTRDALIVCCSAAVSGNCLVERQ